MKLRSSITINSKDYAKGGGRKPALFLCPKNYPFPQNNSGSMSLLFLNSSVGFAAPAC